MPPRRPNDILSIVQNATPPEPVNKGRLMFVEDVQALLPKRNGKPVSRWWCNRSFAPEYALKIGRSKAWWEADALRWINAQRWRR